MAAVMSYSVDIEHFCKGFLLHKLIVLLYNIITENLSKRIKLYSWLHAAAFAENTDAFLLIIRAYLLKFRCLPLKQGE